MTEADLLGLTADQRMLAAPPAQLPAQLRRPPDLPVLAARDRIVGAGVTMTAVTLLAGCALAVFGAVSLLFDNDGAPAIIALLVALLLIGTHWGWVHVAEVTAQSLERRAGAPVITAQQAWLAEIPPYTRHEVVTRALADGSIAIDRVSFVPVRVTDTTFVFTRDSEQREVHGPDASAAVVAARTEALRHEAALQTEQERAAWEDRATSATAAQLAAGDAADSQNVSAAAARALSDQLNANLRDPPLTE